MSQDLVLHCPRGDPKDPRGSLVLDLNYIVRVEQRHEEIATVTKHKAPELLSTFSRAWKEASKYVLWMTKEVNSAKRAVAQEMARIRLDDAPKYFKEHDIRSSKENVEALAERDERYKSAVDRLEQLVAMKELLALKKDSFEMDYNSVKKILGGGERPFYPGEYNGASDDSAVAGQTVDDYGHPIEPDWTK